MPLLSYTSSGFPFVTLTAIASADMNTTFNDIKTLLNTTKLDDTNLQAAGITRATKLKAGTANYVVINAADGTMSEEAALATSRGGLGANLAPSAANANQVIAVNSSGTGFTLAATPSVTIYNYFSFF